MFQYSAYWFIFSVALLQQLALWFTQATLLFTKSFAGNRLHQAQIIARRMASSSPTCRTVALHLALIFYHYLRKYRSAVQHQGDATKIGLCDGALKFMPKPWLEDMDCNKSLNCQQLTFVKFITCTYLPGPPPQQPTTCSHGHPRG